MIRIARVRLKNFKSFRKANIPFHPGFTCIAGSNASGKSNILDSVLFAMGATSLKMLRASRLTDLVNHDAEDNYAKVELVLNENSHEIEVKRLIDKKGRGVVKLNGKKRAWTRSSPTWPSWGSVRTGTTLSCKATSRASSR